MIIFTETEKHKIINLYQNRLATTIEIGNEFKTSEDTIVRRLKQWGVYIGRVPISKVEKEQIITLYQNQKVSIKDISRKFNTSERFINKKLKQWGIVIRSRPDRIKLSDQQKQEILNLYHSKAKTTKEIADQFNMSITTIYRKLKKWGVETNG